MADARKDRRTLLSLKIRYKSATLEDFIERYSMDISRGGVFIKAKKPLAVGTLLKFEFVLQDQSILIHGVGRVAWRREEHEADVDNPAGMGIKFIKMDPDSRSIVDRIVEERGLPGVFDQGKEGLSPEHSSMPSEPGPQAADATKVRHVSEFLASAMEQGGAGDAAIRAARAGAQHARAASERAGAARGAFSATGDTAGRQRRGMSDAPGRGAMSAFGGASMGSSGGFRSSAAPAMDDMDELDDDDFLDNETTKVQELLSASEYPDAAATVIASETPFAAQPLVTPVVPASASSRSSLQQAVPDLFGPDSFGPAPGELIDASLLDPAVVTVPPKASALPRSAMPDAQPIHAGALRAPQAPAPVGTHRSPSKQKKSRVGLLLFLVFVLLLVASGAAVWQLGLSDDLMKLAAPYLGQSSEPANEAAPVSRPAVPVTATDKPAEGELPAADNEASANEAPADEASGEVGERTAPADRDAAPATDKAGLVKMKVVSVPIGAFVSVNGKAAGRTPLTVEYEAGTKLTLFSKTRGFLAHREQVVVDASRPELKMVLSPLPWVVEVVTEPPGARASAVGGGQVTTPDNLSFRSMPSSRDIVISKDGFKTVTKSISRELFVEERSRMAASVRVTLAKDGTTARAADPAPAGESVDVPKASTAEPPAQREPVEAAEPAPTSEQTAPATAKPSADDGL